MGACHRRQGSLAQSDLEPDHRSCGPHSNFMASSSLLETQNRRPHLTLSQNPHFNNIPRALTHILQRKVKLECEKNLQVFVWNPESPDSSSLRHLTDMWPRECCSLWHLSFSFVKMHQLRWVTSKVRCHIGYGSPLSTMSPVSLLLEHVSLGKIMLPFQNNLSPSSVSLVCPQTPPCRVFELTFLLWSKQSHRSGAFFPHLATRETIPHCIVQGAVREWTKPIHTGDPANRHVFLRSRIHGHNKMRAALFFYTAPR
jgi:hypothetical protein